MFSQNRKLAANAKIIELELIWLKEIIASRITSYNSSQSEEIFNNIVVPETKLLTYYSSLVNDLKLNLADRVLLICALATYVEPGFYLMLVSKDENSSVLRLPDFGLDFDTDKKDYNATLQTAIYLLAGDNKEMAFNCRMFFLDNSTLIKQQVILLQPKRYQENNKEEDVLLSQIKIAPEYVNLMIYGKEPLPPFNASFPAKQINTPLSWQHLVVHPVVLAELERIGLWLQHGQALIKNSQGLINPSFPCLFHGPPGTGKTLAVQLLGKHSDRQVFRVDLSMVVNKYVGETEKNLARLFDRAAHQNWILFFDEADSLFGKRGDVKDANDKYANLEMSYLLQRMEEHPGLTILATNLKSNLDTALTRRFQAVLYFSRPDENQRRELWKNLMPPPYHYNTPGDIDTLATYDFTGANVANCIKAACLQAESRGQLSVDLADLKAAVRREFAKEGRTPGK